MLKLLSIVSSPAIVSQPTVLVTSAAVSKSHKIAENLHGFIKDRNRQHHRFWTGSNLRAANSSDVPGSGIGLCPLPPTTSKDREKLHRWLVKRGIDSITDLDWEQFASSRVTIRFKD